MRVAFILVIYTLCSSSFAQDTWSLQKVLQNVQQYHPLAKIAGLQTDMASSELMTAKGQFDPKVELEQYSKSLGSIDYYQSTLGSLKVPLWPGLDLKAGFEINNGQFLNPSETNGSLSYAGFSIPILQGLITDERRTMVKQARIAIHMAAAERQKLLNKLYFEVTKVYYDWYAAYYNYRFQNIAVGLADERYRGIVNQVRMGDMSGLDSVEAFLEYQRRKVSASEAAMEWLKQSFYITSFLWLNDTSGVPLDTSRVPDESIYQFNITGNPDSSYQFTMRNQPELLKTQGKIQWLQTDLRFRKEMLKPRLDVQYAPLFSAKYPLGFQSFSNSYKWGAGFSFPLYLRKERGKLQLTQQKIATEQYQYSWLKRDFQRQIYSAYNEMNMLKTLNTLQEGAVYNFAKLREGESERYINGESNLFLVNTRERQYIEALIKWYEYKSKLGKAWGQLAWVTGQISF